MDAEFRVTRIQELSRDHPAPALQAVLGQTPWACDALNLDDAAWQSHRLVLQAHQVFRGFEIHRRAPNGRFYWTRISGRPRFDDAGAFLGYHGVDVDITHLKETEARLQELAFYDVLTGLPNRRLLLDRIEQAVARMARE